MVGSVPRSSSAQWLTGRRIAFRPFVSVEAGLQALATAKRLGAVTWGYDIRAAVKEQVPGVTQVNVRFDSQVRADNRIAGKLNLPSGLCHHK